MTKPLHPLTLSSVLHLCVLIPFLLISVVTNKNRLDLVEFEFVEAPKAKPEPLPSKTLESQEQLRIRQKKSVSQLPAEAVKEVFGIRRDALTSEAQNALVLKQGNTITKEVDQEQLAGDGELPVPKPEYLVTRMPVLKFKPELPYPPQAKANNIEGRVVFNLLIDERGQVREALVLEGPAFGLKEAAEQAIVDFEFEPALIGQEAVAIRIRYVLTFELR